MRRYVHLQPGRLPADYLRDLTDARTFKTICDPSIPPPSSETWDCEDWTIAVIRLLEERGFALTTNGADNEGILINSLISDSLRAQKLTEELGDGPVFVQLSFPPQHRR